MRPVEDETGHRYLLLKRSTESSLVRDLSTGEREHLPNADLSVVGAAAPLETAAGALAPDRREQLPVSGDRAAGLLVELVQGGPRPVRDLLGSTELCESDLNGLVGELRAAGLVTETTVHGRRGYAATETAADLLAPEDA